MTSRQARVLLVISVLLCVLAYSNTFQAPFQFDDHIVISETDRYTDISNVPEMFYEFSTPWSSRPLLHATVAVNYYLGGLDTTGYHIVNLALHILNGVLLYLLIVMTCMRAGRDEGYVRTAALVSSALFLLHPVQTEAVTYIISRSMLMATTFCFLGLLFFLKAATDLRRRWLYMAGLFAASMLGMASRENFATFPLLLFLYDMFFISGFRPREALRRYSIYLPAVLALGYWAFLALNNTYDTSADNPGVGFTPAQYALTQFNVHMTYLRLLILPVNQNIDYDYPVASSLLEPSTMAAFLGYVAIWAAALFFARRRRAAAFAVLWFLVTLLPISFGVAFLGLKLDDAIFEHRLYLPGAGLTVIAAFGAARLREGLSDGPRIFLNAAVVILVLAFCFATFARNQQWRSTTGLWRDALKKSPEKVRAYYNLGHEYFRQGQPEEAIEVLSVAEKMAPDEADIQEILGVSYDLSDMPDKAIEHYLKALALAPERPDTQTNLGIVYRKKGMLDEAIDMFRRALETDPDMAEAHFHLGEAYRARGQTDKAIPHLRAAIRLDPEDPDAHIELGGVMGFLGRYDDAILHFKTALNLDPDNAYAHFNLGVAYVGKGMPDAAEEQLGAALRLDPGNEDAQRWLETLRRQRVQ